MKSGPTVIIFNNNNNSRNSNNSSSSNNNNINSSSSSSNNNNNNNKTSGVLEHKWRASLKLHNCYINTVAYCYNYDKERIDSLLPLPQTRIENRIPVCCQV